MGGGGGGGAGSEASGSFAMPSAAGAAAMGGLARISTGEDRGGSSGLSGSFALTPMGGGGGGGTGNALTTMNSSMFDSMADLHMLTGGGGAFQIPVWDDETNMLILKVRLAPLMRV